jgi:hypothetical protein
MKDIIRILSEAGYVEDKTVTQLFSDTRLLFHDNVWPAYRHLLQRAGLLPLRLLRRQVGGGRADPAPGRAFIGKNADCEDQRERPDRHDPLLREHPVGDTDQETINAGIIARILGNDWGFWRSVTANLKLTAEMLDGYAGLTDEDRRVVRERIGQLQQLIDAQPKSLRWKLRSNVGDRVKWYKDVEELMNR